MFSSIIAMTAMVTLLPVSSPDVPFTSDLDAKPGASFQANPNASRLVKRTLSTLNGKYWEWVLAGADPAEAQFGPITFLPLPEGKVSEIRPDGTVVLSGHLDYTMTQPGFLFVPLAVELGESYTPESNTPDDVPFTEQELHDTFTVMAKLNGRALWTPRAPSYFFDPIISIDPPMWATIGCTSSADFLL